LSFFTIIHKHKTPVKLFDMQDGYSRFLFLYQHYSLYMCSMRKHIHRLDGGDLVAVAQESEIAGKCRGIATDVDDPFTIGFSNDIEGGWVKPFSRGVNDNDIDHQFVILFVKPLGRVSLDKVNVFDAV